MAELQVFTSSRLQSNPISTTLIYLQGLCNVIWGKADDQLSMWGLWRGFGLFHFALSYRLASIPPDIQTWYLPNTSGIRYDRLQRHNARNELNCFITAYYTYVWIRVRRDGVEYLDLWNDRVKPEETPVRNIGLRVWYICNLQTDIARLATKLGNDVNSDGMGSAFESIESVSSNQSRWMRVLVQIWWTTRNTIQTYETFLRESATRDTLILNVRVWNVYRKTYSSILHCAASRRMENAETNAVHCSPN
jgi:hypothetical protein